ncbi:MAG: hypothetical protein B6U87_01180 [Candidatus Aenigmarchaeota archaeon ex4484_52]|nr:MAG: hypothetical protein B6U87_01180 [Candidatus Aenigmarchaeota archaeon ex4484_52]
MADEQNNDNPNDGNDENNQQQDDSQNPRVGRFRKFAQRVKSVPGSITDKVHETRGKIKAIVTVADANNNPQPNASVGAYKDLERVASGKDKGNGEYIFYLPSDTYSFTATKDDIDGRVDNITIPTNQPITIQLQGVPRSGTGRGRGKKKNKVVEVYNNLYRRLLQYETQNWKGLEQESDQELVSLQKQLREANPIIIDEEERQQKLIRSGAVGVPGKTIGEKELEERTKNLSEEEKQKEVEKVEKRKEVVKHINPIGKLFSKTRLKHWATKARGKVIGFTGKHKRISSFLGHDYWMSLTFFLIYTMYFWQFARVSFLLSVGFGVVGWLISKIVFNDPGKGITFCLFVGILWGFNKVIGLNIFDPFTFILLLVVVVITYMISEAVIQPLVGPAEGPKRKLAGFIANLLVFFTIIYFIYPHFAQLIQLGDMATSSYTTNLDPILEPIMKGLNSTMLILTDPTKWYQNYFLKKDVDKSEEVQAKALRITEMKTYLPTYYSGQSGGGHLTLENFGEKPARNVRFVVYIPNQVWWMGKWAKEHEWAADWLPQDDLLEWSESDLAKVNLEGVSKMKQIQPKQPKLINYHITMPASCTGSFTIIGKVVYDYSMETIGILSVVSKKYYDDLAMEEKLKTDNMKTTSASGPISVSMKTQPFLPISADTPFVFIISPLNFDTGTVRINNFYVYIPKQFIVHTDQPGCALLKEDCQIDEKECKGNNKFKVRMSGISSRCFSSNVGPVYSCRLQLAPEESDKLITKDDFDFKAKIDYTYALKSQTQFNVMNSMEASAIEYKKCPQETTYKDNYNLLMCDKKRDYFYICDEGLVEKLAKEAGLDTYGTNYCKDREIDKIYKNLDLDDDDIKKLKTIGNIASYMVFNADLDGSKFSAIDNDFLDDAVAINENIGVFSILKTRADAEGQQVNVQLESDIKNAVSGMIKYISEGYFLNNTSYKYSINYKDWQKGIKNIEALEDIKNIKPIRDATKKNDLIFIGNKYKLAANSLKQRQSWLDLVQFEKNCEKYYIDHPGTSRFCIGKTDFDEVEKASTDAIGKCKECCSGAACFADCEDKKKECINEGEEEEFCEEAKKKCEEDCDIPEDKKKCEEDCDKGKGECFTEESLPKKIFNAIKDFKDWLSTIGGKIEDTLSGEIKKQKEEQEKKIKEINELKSNILKAQQKADTKEKGKEDCEGDFFKIKGEEYDKDDICIKRNSDLCKISPLSPDATLVNYFKCLIEEKREYTYYKNGKLKTAKSTIKDIVEDIIDK